MDPIAWRTELERVAPRLRVHSTVSGKEWRAHLEQTQAHEKVCLLLFLLLLLACVASCLFVLWLVKLLRSCCCTMLTPARKPHRQTILSVLPETQSALEKIGNEVGNMLRRVENKEKYLNNQFDSYVRLVSSDVQRSRGSHRSISHTIAACRADSCGWLLLVRVCYCRPTNTGRRRSGWQQRKSHTRAQARRLPP